MPVCPICHEDFPRRKNDTCPGCGSLIKLRDGKWYSLSESAPNVRLLKYWEKLMTRRIKERFRLPRKADRFKREAKFAQDLLDEAEYDIDVSLRAMWILFNDKDFSWKLYTSLLSVRTDWLTVVFLARQYVEKEREAQEIEKRQFEEYQEMDDLWK